MTVCKVDSHTFETIKISTFAFSASGECYRMDA